MRLDEYYRERGFSPTFADLRTKAALAAYEAMRAAMFRDRLALPPRIFRDARVLEFGPDTGENALVFARWGAAMTLAEPNAAAHPAIRAYFERAGLPFVLLDPEGVDVLAFRSSERYDFIVAEGFIHTVKPVRAWLDAFRRLLVDDGMFVVSYYERYGAFVELALRALYACYRRATGSEPVAAAGDLYRAKWDAIPHSRRFESWVFDVLDNPLQSLSAAIDARALVGDALAAGFDLYASYPRYTDVLEVEWHKTSVSPAERAARAQRHIARSTLSFLAGRTLYLVDDGIAREVTQAADAVLAAVDALYWADDPAAAATVATGLGRFVDAIANAPLAAADPAERSAAAAGFTALASAFECVAAGRSSDLPSRTVDPAFIALWGAPNHLAVGRAVRAGAATP